MRAIHESGAARTAFTVQADTPEREAQLAALMGAEICEEPLEGGDLGHQDHTPVDEQLYCAGRWESQDSASQDSASQLCPELPLQVA